MSSLKKCENVDLCACKYEVDDPDVDNILDVLMTTMLMNVEVGGNIFHIFDDSD